jgi:hypothetical protein
MTEILRFNAEAIYNKNETEQVSDHYEFSEIKELHEFIEKCGKTFYALDKIIVTLADTDLKTTLDAAEQE